MKAVTTELHLTLVRAFSAHPAGGNPAGVVLLNAELSSDLSSVQLQQLAAQSAQPVTAFVKAAAGGYTIRWFTPTQEINLCGHGTLAAAAVLFAQQPTCSTLQFFSTYGDIAVTRTERGYCLQLPCFALPPIAVTALPLSVTQGRTIAAAVGRDLVLELNSAAAVRAYQPDFQAMRQLPWHAVLVTALAETAATAEPACYLFRYFAPGIGIDEDPATGSAHCSLLPYWQAKLPQPEQRWQAIQCSSAGGEFEVQQLGSVLQLTSQAVVYGQRVLQL